MTMSDSILGVMCAVGRDIPPAILREYESPSLMSRKGVQPGGVGHGHVLDKNAELAALIPYIFSFTRYLALAIE